MDEPFEDPAEAEAWLDAHIDYERVAPTRRSIPTLDAMRELARLLGNPERSYPVLHLTGTNGKGSTTAMCSALLAVLGLSVGTYTSPNLHRVHERIAVNGQPIPPEALAELCWLLRALEPSLGERPTRFELLTMAALRYFSDEAVDVGVIEVGLGGSWDSTNICDAAVAVLTNVEFDHVEILGPTRADIARDKAGIIKPGSIAVIGERDPELQQLIVREAEARGAAQVLLAGVDFDLEANTLAVGGRLLSIRTPYGRYDEVFCSLHGAHQGANAAVAVVAVEAFLGRALPEAVVDQVLGAASVPARCEVVSHRPLVVIDGAHNVAGTQALAATVTEAFAVEGRRVLVTGMLRGRDPKELLAPLAEAGFTEAVICAPDTPRAMATDEVAAAAAAMGMAVQVIADVAEACRSAVKRSKPEDLVVIAGSLYVAGAARAALS